MLLSCRVVVQQYGPGEHCGNAGGKRLGSPAPEPLYVPVLMGEHLTPHIYHHFPPNGPVGLGRTVADALLVRIQGPEK